MLATRISESWEVFAAALGALPLPLCTAMFFATRLERIVMQSTARTALLDGVLEVREAHPRRVLGMHTLAQGNTISMHPLQSSATGPELQSAPTSNLSRS